MIRFLTAGESHGRCLVAIIEGVPAGLGISAEDIDLQLGRRQKGYGRGERMKIEQDRVQILAGVRGGKTLGSPISLLVENRDWDNWKDAMSPSSIEKGRKVTRPRPGHADLAGAIKYNQRDIRNILERASARETAIRVAIGAIARKLLAEFDIEIFSHVIKIGKSEVVPSSLANWEEIRERAENSPLRCADKIAEGEMIEEIDRAKEEGDSLGGIFEVVVLNPPIGLGSHTHWDRRLDGRLAQALMSIPAIKGVEIGLGFQVADRRGSQIHDEIFYRKGGFYRRSNNAGGLEGGITNGEPIILRAAMKPIPSLSKPLHSIDIETKESFEATKERADVCAVPAAGVVGEAVVTIEIAEAMLEKFGGDSLDEMKNNFRNYMSYVRKF